MSEKLNQEELEQLQGLRSEASNLAATLGEYAYQKTLLEAELDIIKVGIRDNAKKQQEFLRTLGEKYGDGAINFKTGEISLNSPQ